MQFFVQDLQIQTNYSDGRNSVDELVRASVAHGRRIIGITDHAIGWDEGDEHCEFFMTAAKFKNYLAEIERARQHYESQGITILKGLEVEIGLDGHMALAPGILEVIGSENNLLKHIDYAIGVIHSESFTASLQQLGRPVSEEEKLAFLTQNIAALIANPQIRIWGHPFQVVHGHYIRHFTATEQAFILKQLHHRPDLLIEYNLNPTPRYQEWQAKSTHYENGSLAPNDLTFLKRCADGGSRFVISTDAHDIAQTGRLTAAAKVPGFIRSRLVDFTET
jgi:histidinol phosphatase-like PHP family hydrolase